MIGNDVSIEPFVYISANAVIGDKTWIGPGAVIMEGARIGRNCRIFPLSVISGIPQDMKFRGEETIAEIGDGVIIREGVTVNRGTAAAGRTVVGENCLIMAYAHIGHDCFIGNNCIIGNNCGLAGEVKIDDWAILSGGVLVHQFSHIGGHVIVGGGSKVRTDVPPFIKADRDPLCYLGLNTVGLTRRNFGKERIDEIHNIYRILYQSKRNTSQALEFIEKEFTPSADRDYIINFIRKSERGIIKGPK
ncbi:MAG TPA: acyl-[acyl-carrier-protein]--UDP-N-acetylglucosamine O-acyltransferase [Bacteroidales bacterium]|nr:acyl-[acyl-carrier-protein]--UDP-N-acetylglucosamine O-acyltransferase [Bacteroidales bacterium]